MVRTETLDSSDIELFRKIDCYWRAANYLSAGQIYLLDNPLLKEKLTLEHIKPRLLGHWGTVPGINFVYAHLNRIIQNKDLNIALVTGPGHGSPGILANAYLEGSYTEYYPEISQDEEGMKKFFRQFSFPGGIPSHTSPDTPGSIHEGGELGYSLTHAYGAAFDNPHLIAVCIVGDGEAETGTLAASWHSNKFLNPLNDGAVLPILHLNGYKIANPTILARISKEELEHLFLGYGYKPYFVEGDDAHALHPKMAEVMDRLFQEIESIWHDARVKGIAHRPHWPMLILRTPKGWSGPKFIDKKPVEGTWRSHQVPITNLDNKSHLNALENWLKSYNLEDFFDTKGSLIEELKTLIPKGTRRIGMNPHMNGGVLLKELRLPDFKDYAIEFKTPGTQKEEGPKILGNFLRDALRLNEENKNFRLFAPDEMRSNRLGAVFEATDAMFYGTLEETDEHLSSQGRVLEVLSEQLCQGWLEGYLLTGRHGIFTCYEAFIHIIDSMFNQHAKWIKSAKAIPWRRPIASLNYLLTSHVWQQDHNGFSHQDPGFIDHVVNKKADTIRVYLPPDTNSLLSVTDHCLKTRNYVNVIIAGKHPSLQYLSIHEAIQHCSKGAGVWKWASSDYGSEPDIVMACAGDVPTLETLAAADLLYQLLPEIKIRIVNIIDLMTLQPNTVHPHGLSDAEFDDLFTKDRPILFAFHGYPWLIHRLTYRRTNHENLHVRGYQEEGTTTTPFDMTVKNGLDRFHLMIDAIEYIERFAHLRAYIRDFGEHQLINHRLYIEKHGEDLPDIRNWKWQR
jgi:xylulose-5-phosphate/fructose-6-phosphate phosphoketolase